MKNFYKRGVTALELLIVVAILGILVALILPQFSKIRENQLMKNGVSDTLSAIEKARSRTLASVNSSEYGVHFQADSDIIFKGKVFSGGATDNETIPIYSPITISNVTLGGVSGVSGDLYFSRIYGVPSKIGTVTVAGSSLSRVITISATGGAN